MRGVSNASRILLGGFFCAAAYGAAVNILTFVRPALAGSTDGSLAAPLVLQAIATALGVLATIGLAVGFRLAARIPGGRFSRLSAAGLESCGAVGLAVAALALGAVNSQAVLLACAALTVGTALAAGDRGVREAGRTGASHAGCWTAVVLLVVVPYLADLRPFGFEPFPTTAIAATAVVGVAIASLRRPRVLRVRLSARESALTLALLVAVGLFGAGVVVASRPPLPRSPVVRHASEAHPNVILVSMDTVRADHTSLHGYIRNTTPALRGEWLAGATLYTRAISTADWTLPSTASLLTGLLATNHQAITRSLTRQSAISPAAATLAELLRAAGFRTYAVVANYANLSPRFGFDRGFDYYSCRRSSTAFSVKPYFLAAAAWRWMPARWRKATRSAQDITGEALRLLEGAHDPEAGPFLLFLNYMDAHTPYLPPDDYRRRFGPPRPPFSWSRYEALASAVIAERRHVSPDERRDLEADYDAGIAYIDDSLGRLFSRLRQLGLFDRSLIIVTSDHGEMFGESDVVGHGAGLFPELVHVPLLVKYPGQHQSATVEHVVSGADILPTVLAAAGLPEAALPLDGHSLLDDADSREFFATSESFELDFLATQHPRFAGDERAAFVGPLVHRMRRDGKTMSERWEAAGPPAAGAPATGSRPDLIAGLLALAEAANSLPATPAVEPDVLDSLRALGYVGR